MRISLFSLVRPLGSGLKTPECNTEREAIKDMSRMFSCFRQEMVLLDAKQLFIEQGARLLFCSHCEFIGDSLHVAC